MEVCNLNELGYPLAPSQGELTVIQKLFLGYAYSEFPKIQKELGEKSGGSPSLSDEESFKARYRKQQLENRRKYNEQRS
jgi:hypothetical protein